MAQLLPLALRPDLCLLRLIPTKSIRFVQKESLKLLRNQQTDQIQSHPTLLSLTRARSVTDNLTILLATPSASPLSQSH
ncbi:unnamed protein product [Rhodiola kirilowii]